MIPYVVLFSLLFLQCSNPVSSDIFKGNVTEEGHLLFWMEYAEVEESIDGSNVRALDISLVLTQKSAYAVEVDSFARGTYIQVYPENSLLPLWASPPSWSIQDTGYIKTVTIGVNDTLRYKDRWRFVDQQMRSLPTGRYEIQGQFLGHSMSSIVYRIN